MKLIRLKMFYEFRGIKQKDYEINFHNEIINEKLNQFHPFCFVGLNGSGKSNILEALSNIFYHLECCTNGYPKYAFRRNESNPNAYELEYFISPATTSSGLNDLLKIKITKAVGSAPKMSINGDNEIEISKTFGSSCLPDLIVAYSSGENETLSLPFVKMKLYQYDEYLRDLIGKMYMKDLKAAFYLLTTK